MEVLKLANGDKIVQGSVIECAGKFHHIFAVKNGRALTTDVNFDTPKEAENIYCEKCSWYSTQDELDNFKLYSQPILGQDKNGEDVRWGDMVLYLGDKLKAIGFIKSLKETNRDSFIVENDGYGKGWDWIYCSNITKVKEEEKMITIKGKEYSEDTIHKSLKEYVK